MPMHFPLTKQTKLKVPAIAMTLIQLTLNFPIIVFAYDEFLQN